MCIFHEDLVNNSIERITKTIPAPRKLRFEGLSVICKEEFDEFIISWNRMVYLSTSQLPWFFCSPRYAFNKSLSI